MAAAAGSPVNALGTAQKDALRDQMGWIRTVSYTHLDLELTNNGGKLSVNGAMTKLGEGKVTFNSSNNRCV